MRAFLYGFIGLILAIFLFYLLNEKFGEYANPIILSTILCGCTGAIVSAIKSEKDNITKENLENKDK